LLLPPVRQFHSLLMQSVVSRRVESRFPPLGTHSPSPPPRPPSRYCAPATRCLLRPRQGSRPGQPQVPCGRPPSAAHPAPAERSAPREHPPHRQECTPKAPP